METLQPQLSYDSFEFSHKILEMIEKTKLFLFKNWLPKVYNICVNVRVEFLKNVIYFNSIKQNLNLQADKKKQLPEKGDKLNLDIKFWNCLAKVMEVQLQRLCLKSIGDYMKLLEDISVSAKINRLLIRN